MVTGHIWDHICSVARLQDSLGTRLMALRGLKTRTVRMADRLMFCRSKEYSTILQRDGEVRGVSFGGWCLDGRGMLGRGL